MSEVRAALCAGPERSSARQGVDFLAPSVLVLGARGLRHDRMPMRMIPDKEARVFADSGEGDYLDRRRCQSPDSLVCLAALPWRPGPLSRAVRVPPVRGPAVLPCRMRDPPHRRRCLPGRAAPEHRLSGRRLPVSAGPGADVTDPTKAPGTYRSTTAAEPSDRTTGRLPREGGCHGVITRTSEGTMQTTRSRA